jgi:tetratricopeptide (TPR) repeat protein
MQKIIVLLWLFFLTSTASAQDQKDFAYYNQETYRLYTEANWEELIVLAKKSFKSGYDSYYLRMRIGIALYEQKKYTQAKTHFEKALKHFPGSADTRSYLYYCYLFLGRRQEALQFVDMVGKKPKFFQSILFEPGIKLSDNKTSTRNTKYFFVGLNHDFGKRVSFSHGYQRLGSDFAYFTSGSGGQGPGPRYGQESIYSIYQNEYYATLNISMGKGFYLSPAFHIQQVIFGDDKSNNKVYSFQLAKWLGKIKLYGGYYYSDINALNQSQTEGGVVYYPIGNANLYLQTQATYYEQNSENNMVWFNKIGVKLFPGTWVDLSMSTGDMINFSELNGLVVYNQLDVIKSRWGISLNQLVGKHSFYVKYINENKEEFDTSIPFAHHDIILGINLTF